MWISDRSKVLLNLDWWKNFVFFPLGLLLIFFNINWTVSIFGELRLQFIFKWYDLRLDCGLLIKSFCLHSLSAASNYVSRWVILWISVFHTFRSILGSSIEHPLMRRSTNFDVVNFLDGSFCCKNHSNVPFFANLRNLPLKPTDEIFLLLGLLLYDSRAMIASVSIVIVDGINLFIIVRVRCGWRLWIGFANKFTIKFLARWTRVSWGQLLLMHHDYYLFLTLFLSRWL